MLSSAHKYPQTRTQAKLADLRHAQTHGQTHLRETQTSFGWNLSVTWEDSPAELGTPPAPPATMRGSPFWFFSTSHSSRTSMRCSPISRQRLLNLFPSRMHSCTIQPGFAGNLLRSRLNQGSPRADQQLLTMLLARQHSCKDPSRIVRIP